jgi:hypothetical protein
MGGTLSIIIQGKGQKGKWVKEKKVMDDGEELSS